MSKIIKVVLMIVVALAAAGIFAFYAYAGYRSDYCTDEVPDVTSIYVYTVDKGLGDLNRTYLSGKNFAIPKDEAKYMTYEDIPLLP